MAGVKNQLPLFWTTLVALASPLGSGAADRPNILYIMSDDHAAHAISAYGSRVNQTPNLDRLAKAGMRFDNCFCVNSICSPAGRRSSPANTAISTACRPSTALTVRSPRWPSSPGGGVLYGHDRQVAPGQRPHRVRPVDHFAGARGLFRSAVHRARGPARNQGLRDRHHHRPGHGFPQEPAKGKTVLPDVPSQGAPPVVGTR